MPAQVVLVRVNGGVRRFRLRPFTSLHASSSSRCRGAANGRQFLQQPSLLRVQRLRRVSAAEGTEEAVPATTAAAAAPEETPVKAEVEVEAVVVESEVAADEDAEEEYEFKDDFLDKTFSEEEKALAEASVGLFNTIEDEFEAQVKAIFKSELTTDESTSLFEAFGQLDAFATQLSSMSPEKLEELLRSVEADEDDDEEDLDVVEVDFDQTEVVEDIVEAPVDEAPATPVEAAAPVEDAAPVEVAAAAAATVAAAAAAAAPAPSAGYSAS